MRQVPKQIGEEQANKMYCSYFEVSSRNATNLEQVVNSLVHEIQVNRDNRKSKSIFQGFGISTPKPSPMELQKNKGK